MVETSKTIWLALIFSFLLFITIVIFIDISGGKVQSEVTTIKCNNACNLYGWKALPSSQLEFVRLKNLELAEVTCVCLEK